MPRTELYFDDFPPTQDECEMARLLDLIDAEWRSDPLSAAWFDLRIVEGVRKSLATFREREAKSKL